MRDFDMLMEKASPVGREQSVDHYFVYFERNRPSFDMKERNYSFPKCPDPMCVDRDDHTIERETLLTDPVSELAYDYFVKGHSLHFIKCQHVSGVVGRLQKLFDDGGVDYDKTMSFELRFQGRVTKWDSANYLSRMKQIVDPERKNEFPSLRDIIYRTWSSKFPESIRLTCISVVQELMVADYLHSLSRMRPDYDMELVRRLAYANKTDCNPDLPWTFNVRVEFIPSQRRKREAADISYHVSLEFHSSTNRRPPYDDVSADDTDVMEDSDD
jgi:hypothetical protein